MKKITCLSFLLLTLLFLVSSCKKEEPKITNNSVLIYLAANNNLYPAIPDLVNQLKKGYLPQMLDKENNLLIYFHTYEDKPVLCKMNCRADGGIDSTIIRVYPTETNSTTAEQLAQVLKDAEYYCPAQRHSLIFWSHGTGYVPEGYKPEQRTKSNSQPLRAVGYDWDTNSEIEIQDFAAALLPVKYDFILFDCCLMGGVEVAYELKDAADYIVFSATEIMNQGFPYYMMMEPVFKGTSVENAMIDIAKEYYKYYQERYEMTKCFYKPEGGTVAVIRTANLPALAKQSKTLFEKYHDQLYALDPDTIQPFYQGRMYWFYDLEDIISHIATSEETDDFNDVLGEVVAYKAATPEFQTIDIQTYCGLSCYLPDPGFVKLNAYYKKLKWNQATALVPEE